MDTYRCEGFLQLLLLSNCVLLSLLDFNFLLFVFAELGEGGFCLLASFLNKLQSAFGYSGG